MPDEFAATRHVKVAEPIAQRLEALRDALAERSGRRITLGETAARAIEALEDCHERGAWLNPGEAAAAMQERSKQTIVDVVGEVLRHVAPEAAFGGIAFDDEGGLAFAHFADRAPVAVAVGPPTGHRDRAVLN